MEERIKLTISRLEKSKNPQAFYLEKLNKLLHHTTKENWVNTGQYHNAKIFKRNYPEFDIPKGVRQVMFYAGDYIVCLHNDTFVWGGCEFKDLSDIENCIWDKESKNYE